MSDNETSRTEAEAIAAATREAHPCDIAPLLAANARLQEGMLVLAREIDDLRKIVRWAGVQLGASSIEHLRALAASSSEVPR